MKRKVSSNGANRLEDAVTNLIQSQALLAQNQVKFLQSMSEWRLDMLSMKEELIEIKRILIRHEQILNGLPEAIRQKIGFDKSV